MEDRLTREEVLHVAKLARIGLDESEIEKYQVQLKALMDDVEKIKYIDNVDDDILIMPVDYEAEMRDDTVGDMLPIDDIMKNVPRKNSNFVEVPVMINE